MDPADLSLLAALLLLLAFALGWLLGAARERRLRRDRVAGMRRTIDAYADLFARNGESPCPKP